MKRIKKYLVTILFISLLNILIQPIYANSQSSLPSTLEIGLFFNTTAKSTLNIQTSDGFIINQHRGTDKVQLMKLLNNKEIILRKDGYFLGSGGNYVEYTGPIQQQVGQNKLQGPYHVQIGGVFPNITEAQKFIDSLKIQEAPYLVYEGGWKVFEGLYIDEKMSQQRAGEIKTHTGKEALVVQPSAKRVQVMDQQGNPLFMFDSTEQIYFQSFEIKGTVPVIDVEGKRYRGEITAKRMDNNDMVIINKLPLEEYLYGVVPKEMSPSWPLEALKAQAISARGFAITKMGKFKDNGFDLCNTVNSQDYAGFDREDARSNRAVDETKSMILTHNGNPIEPYYHSNSGGHTENSENIWTGELPYTRGVKDDYSLDAPNSNWTEIFAKEQIKEALDKNGINIGDPVSIKVTEKSVNGRVITLTVEGTAGTETMTKERSRRVLGLKSTWFNVALPGEGNIVAKSATHISSVSPKGVPVMTAQGLKELNNSTNIMIYNGQNYKQLQSGSEGFSFEGRGWGHGIGMSQYGAKKMAELGFDFEQILKHYYTGVKVELR